jgi:hypothetical protein
LRGQPLSRALKSSSPQVNAFDEFGKTADEQAAFLVDFLNSAGARGYGVSPQTSIDKR